MTREEEASEQLKTAIEHGRTDVLRSVLETLENDDQSVDILHFVLNGNCTEYGTLLHLAVKLGQADCVRAILASGADPGVHNSQQQTAYDLADNELVVRVFNEQLLKATAYSNPDKLCVLFQVLWENNCGVYATCMRAKSSDLPRNIGHVCQLLAAGVQVNLIDSEESRNTPLHWAAAYSDKHTINCICSRGANMNAVNKKGYTPLHEAVIKGNTHVVEEMLTHGADAHFLVQDGYIEAVPGSGRDTDPPSSRDGNAFCPDKGKTSFDLGKENLSMMNLLENPPEVNKGNKSLPNGPICSENNEFVKVPYVNGFCDENSSHQLPQLLSPTFKKASSSTDLTTPLKPVVTEEKLSLLWPQPQSILQKDGKPFFIPKKSLPVYIVAGPSADVQAILKLWDLRKEHFNLEDFDIETDILPASVDVNFSSSHILCHVNSQLCPKKGCYKINISHKQLRILCDGCDSLNYAISTVIQLFQVYKQENTSIPQLNIEDWPNLNYRGILLDFSQGRIPKLESLKNTLNMLSLLKINQIYMYTRFKGQDFPEWLHCYSRKDLLEIERYCSDRYVQVIPVLEVAPKVQFEDLAHLFPYFKEYVACFPAARFLNIGPRLSSFVLDVTEDDGIGVVDIHRTIPHNKHQTVQLCGYPLHDANKETLEHLPPDVVFMEYGVQAEHSFKKFCLPLAESGLSFMVCPGTAAWNSIGGCPEAAFRNISSAIQCVVNLGGLGIVICDWSGRGHLVSMPIRWCSHLVGAGLAWNSSVHSDYLYANAAELLNQHVFHDRGSVVGHAVVELGRAETYLLRCSRNQAGDDCKNMPDEHGSVFFKLIISPDEVAIENLGMEPVQRVIKHIKKCQTEISQSDMQCHNSKEVLKEINIIIDLMLFAAIICKTLVLAGRNPVVDAGYATINLGISNLTPTAKTDLANRLLEMVDRFRESWQESYLSDKGLPEALGHLYGLMKQFLPNGDPEELLTIKREAGS